MNNRILRTVFCGLLVLLAGCSSLPPINRELLNQILYTPTPAPVPLPTSTSTPAPVETRQSSTSQTEQAAASPEILHVWLPVQLNPNENNPAAALLKKRLSDFEADHPGVEIDVRLKSETGDANLLDSLAITSMAAPEALPDLIALPHNALEQASQKGLIKPLDISNELQDPAWYPYAKDLAQVNGTAYGIPFAGDAQVMVYRPELVWIKSWNDILLSNSQLIFAGADPLAEMALSLYASAGGELTNAQGKPTLDQNTLVKVLQLFSKGRSVTLFPDADKNLSSDDQVLQEYRARRSDIAVLHFSKYQSSQDGLYQPLMGLSDQQPHYTFADGLIWSLTGRSPEQQRLAMDLAGYLTQDEFLSQWTQASGYLPIRRFSTNEQVDPAVTAVIEALRPIPPVDTMQTLGPLLQEAVLRVIGGEDPEAVARSVIEKLG
jgi:ABC-type glycerol-3-phosphate transport system substrate-binding protein